MFVPLYNDSAHLHLTLADWESLGFSHIAIDALSLLLKPQILIPESVKTIFLDVTIRPGHKISGLKKTHPQHGFSLYSPYDGQKISVTQEKLYALTQYFDHRVIVIDEKNQLVGYEISDKAGQDGEKGILYGHSKNIIQIQEKQWAEISEPIDKTCGCYTCQNFTLAYLHHLSKVGVLLGTRLQIWHNLYHCSIN